MTPGGAATMRPVTFILDSERFCTRMQAVLLCVGAPVVLAVIFLVEGAVASRALQGGLLGAAVLFGLMLPAFFFTQDVTDRLQLDGGGLTLTRRGRTRRWLWSELSAVRLRSRLHPAALVFGRCITFRIPADGRQLPFQRLAGLLFGHGVAVVGDDYFTESETIAARLESYRAAAARGAGARRPESLPAGAGAAIFRARPSGSRWQQAIRPLLWSIAALALGFGILLVLMVNGYGWTEADVRARAGEVLLGGAFVSLVIGIGFYRFARRGENFVLASDDGLHLRRHGKRRQWPWHFVTAFELDGRDRPAITFKAIGEGEEDSAGELEAEEGEDPFAWPEAVSVSIEDAYQIRIERLCETLNDYRSRAIVQ